MEINGADEIIEFLAWQKVIYGLYFIIDDLLFILIFSYPFSKLSSSYVLHQVIPIFSNENQLLTLILQ